MVNAKEILNSFSTPIRYDTQGAEKFDNPRENIDPHIKTQVISMKEGTAQTWSISNANITSLSGSYINFLNAGNGRVIYSDNGKLSGSGIYYSGANGNVGIGTTGPTHKLDIIGDLRLRAVNGSHEFVTSVTDTVGTVLSDNWGYLDLQTGYLAPESRLRITNTGNVGIGTTGPGTKLHVVGANTANIFKLELSSPTTALYGDYGNSILYNSNTTDNNYNAIYFDTKDAGGTVTDAAAIHAIYSSHTTNAVSGNLAFSTMNAGTMGERMRILSTGNVGIGTNSPQYKEHISGGALAIANTSQPATPANDGALFVSGGALYFVGSSGTTTRIAVA